MIISSGYCLHLITLFSWHTLLIQHMHLSFWGTLKDGEANSLSVMGASTPSSTR